MPDKLLDDPEFRFGAWLVTCDPEIYDLAGLHEQGYRSVANWRVQPSRRTERMATGDRIVLWMTASPDGPAAGVWGVGHVLRPVQAIPADPSPRFAWMDRSQQGHMDHVVETDLRLLQDPVPASALLADPRFSRAEIVTDAQVANPQVLSAGEWEAVAGLLPPGWPDPALWSELAPDALPDAGEQPLDARFEAVTADEVAAATGVDPDVVERVLLNQYEELEACYAAGDLIVTDLSYFCLDDELLRRAQEIEDNIDADRDGAVDELVERLEDLAGDRLVLVPNDLPETPGFLDDTGADPEVAERILDVYWDLVLEQPARLDPFWLGAVEEPGVDGDGLDGRA